MPRIVKIGTCIVAGNRIADAEPIYEDVDNSEDAFRVAKEFIGANQTLCHWWGDWEGVRVMFLADDNGIARELKPNKQGTLAYLGQCIPGTLHVIVGPVVGLLDPELW